MSGADYFLRFEENILGEILMAKKNLKETSHTSMWVRLVT